MLARACPPKSLSAVLALNEHMVFGPSPRRRDCMRAFPYALAHCMRTGFDAIADDMRDMLGAFGGVMRRFVNLVAQIVLCVGIGRNHQEKSKHREKFFHNVSFLAK
ncbi:MAG: hypothetical protein P4L91_19200 [Burkholderiaceae bacterium]|nr:hypothetical protein [Burkholderiaceae bacterium]